MAIQKFGDIARAVLNDKNWFGEECRDILLKPRSFLIWIGGPVGEVHHASKREDIYNHPNMAR